VLSKIDVLVFTVRWNGEPPLLIVGDRGVVEYEYGDIGGVRSGLVIMSGAGFGIPVKGVTVDGAPVNSNRKSGPRRLARNNIPKSYMLLCTFWSCTAVFGWSARSLNSESCRRGS